MSLKIELASNTSSYPRSDAPTAEAESTRDGARFAPVSAEGNGDGEGKRAFAPRRFSVPGRDAPARLPRLIAPHAAARCRILAAGAYDCLYANYTRST